MRAIYNEETGEWETDWSGGPGETNPDTPVGIDPVEPPTAPPPRVRPPMPGNAPTPGTKWQFNEEFWTWVTVPDSSYVPPAATPTTPPSGAPGTGAGGAGGVGVGGGVSEADGRAYDQAHGLIGGYMTATGWVSGSPHGGGGGGGGNGGGGNGAGNFNNIYGAYVNPFAMPSGNFQFTLPPAPPFTAPTFQAPGPFQAPTGDAIRNEPGYDFRLQEGQKALERSNAAKGISRTGGSYKGLIDYGQNFASHEYNNVYDRQFGQYKNDYLMKKDVFDTQYAGAKDEFAPKMDDWRQRGIADQRSAELNWNREWDKYTFSSDDSFRRTKAFQDFLQWQAELGYD